MHFTHLRATNQWLAAGCPTPQAFDEFDRRQYKSLNGDAGGTWNPSAPIVIGGAGLSTTNPLVLSALHRFTTDSGATVTLSGPNTLSGASTLSLGSTTTLGTSAVWRWQSDANAAVVGGATWTLASGSTFSFGGSVTGTLAFQNGFAGTMQNGCTIGIAGGDVAISGTLAHTVGTWSIGIPLTVNSTALVTRQATETISGTGAVWSWRHFGSVDDADGYFDASSDTYHVPRTTASRRFTLLHSGVERSIGGFAVASVVATTGMRIRFSSAQAFETSAPTITFVREDGSTIAVTPASWPWWIEFEFRLGEWHCLSWGHENTVSVLGSFS